ncbi:response regulator [Fluviicola taffensis]|uniref:Response regulator receiver protein n=1 Tax=Fluviicola taffensis (strain DSM 16823 / NCIMB 13979 / RW262) TaxID=755732 RepID=F2ICN5_FLUTR|nr:response regulator transcription factor [Fluviicola taffensis]AEA42262.1 response regulator receiver protein [Fluviicola taffensis DSM 16823]
MNQSISVAYAEDNEPLRLLLVNALETKGPFKVLIKAQDGLDLIQQLIQTSVDIILLDINMPIMNGNEVLEYLKKSQSNTKVIVYSFHNSPEITENYLENGASAFISKDSDIVHIVEEIQRIHYLKS